MRVLLIEDDSTIAVPLADGLLRAGFEVTPAGDALTGLERFADADLVLLDLGLPDLDGAEVCGASASSEVPIIVISARGEEIDRVLLLESGADDYLVKPFGTRELVARIRAVSRRTGTAPAEETIRRFGSLVVDLASHRVLLDDVELDLTPKEFDLLVHLSSEVGVVHRRREILESVWDEHWYGPTKTLDVHIAAVRRKLGDPSWIETVRGVGYRFGIPTWRVGSSPATCS